MINGVIKDKRPSDQLIAKVPMTRNHLFPLRIVPYMNGKTNMGVAFKEEIKETVVYCDNKENDNAEIQVAFQIEVEDDS